MNNNNEKDKQIQDWLKFLTGTSNGYATIPKGKKYFSYYYYPQRKKTKLHCWTNSKFKNRVSLLDNKEKQLIKKCKKKEL